MTMIQRTFAVVATMSGLCGFAFAAEDDASAQEVFKRRLLPIFKSPNPSSCMQCHLAGVDLKSYILPSHEKTFVSLRDQGLIDLEKPENSKILKQIKMGEGDKSASLIQQKARKQEYEAFAAWIKASAADPALKNAPPLTPAELAKPAASGEAIRSARIDKLTESFDRNVWAQRKRCDHCHMPGGRDNAKLVAQYGERVSWLRAEGPDETVRYLISKNLVDPVRPERSLLLLKPTRQVPHAGGIKMKVGDEGYRAFLAWIQDYAGVAKVKAQEKARPAAAGGAAPARPADAPTRPIELAVEGLKDAADSERLRAALMKVAGVRSVVISRRDSGPSSVRVFYVGAEPTTESLIAAAETAKLRATRAGP